MAAVDSVAAPEVTFTYVLIPADDDQPMRELTAPRAKFGDTLASSLKKTFAGGALTNMSSLRAEYGEVVDNKIGDFQSVANIGSVEVMPLVRPSKTNLPRRMTGTYMYMDEMGSLKERPTNSRAAELAKRTGMDLEHPLCGDVYVGRVSLEPDILSSDFLLPEMASSSPWIQQAPAENAEYSGALKGFADTVRSKRIDVKTPEETAAEEEKQGWRWAQTEDEIEVTVLLPEGSGKGDVIVTITNSSLRVALKSDKDKPLMEATKLFDAVRSEDSTWILGSDKKGNHVQVTMEKQKEVTWPRLQSRES